MARHGGYARYARVPAGSALALPAGLSARQAMAIGTAGFTAALSLDQLEQRGLRPGDGPVLVTGASGGVGSFAVDLLAGARLRGGGEHRQGRRARLARAPRAPPRSSGATTSTRPAGRVLGPEHWAGAVDCVGGETLARILQTLRYGAAVAASGLTGGTALQTTVYSFITRGVALLGVDSVQTPIERRREVWARLATDLRPAHLDDLVAGEVTLDGVAGALADILASRVRGRLLVRVDATPTA